MEGEISNAMVRRLQPRSRPYEVTCARLPGFAVRVLPSGKKVFLVRQRVDGRDHRQRLGRVSAELDADEARRQAMAILSGEACPAPVKRARGGVAGRAAAPRRAGRKARPREPALRPPEPLEAKPSQFTVRELAERFLKEHVDVYLKPSSQYAYRRILEKYIIPEYGSRHFESVTRADVKALRARLFDKSHKFEYVLCVLGSLYTRIIDDWELSDMRNPTSGIKRRPSRRVERFLSPEERRAIVEVIDAGVRRSVGTKGALDQASAWAIMLLMLTGQRRGEILSLTWEMVDWQHRCLHFPDTKTGQRSAPISSQAMALLRTIHDATGNPREGLVCRGRRGGKLTRINSSWEMIREAAGCPDVRLHDLRHSFASDALMAGVPLAIVGEMLGHRQPNTTKRYAHLADRVVREALETTGQRIAAAYEHPRPTASEQPFVPLSDAQWAKVAKIIEADRPRGGKPVDLRGIVDGIRWVLQREARWADVPARFGKPTTCWRWFKRWSDDGLWSNIAMV